MRFHTIQKNGASVVAFCVSSGEAGCPLEPCRFYEKYDKEYKTNNEQVGVCDSVHPCPCYDTNCL